MRPLDRLGAIKIKLGVVIVATVACTVAALVVARDAGLPLGFAVLVAQKVDNRFVKLFSHSCSIRALAFPRNRGGAVPGTQKRSQGAR